MWQQKDCFDYLTRSVVLISPKLLLLVNYISAQFLIFAHVSLHYDCIILVT